MDRLVKIEGKQARATSSDENFQLWRVGEGERKREEKEEQDEDRGMRRDWDERIAT